MNAKTLIAAALVAGSGLAAAQDNYFDWAQAGQPDLTPTSVPTPATNRGGLTVFPDRASFDAAGGGEFPVETFDGGTIDGGPTNCGPVIDSATAGGCFGVGDVIDGFQIIATVPAPTRGGGGDLIGLPGGFLGAGQPTDVVGANAFGDVTNLSFSPPVTAAGMDVYVGAPAAGDVVIEAFSGGSSLGSFTITTTATDQPVFAGLVSAAPFDELTITGVGGGGELIDDLTFGTPLPGATAVPTLGFAGILALLLAIGIAGVLARRSLRTS